MPDDPPTSDIPLHPLLPHATSFFPLASASVSILICAAYIVSFVTCRGLRRHPSSLVFGRALYDLVFCAQLSYQLTRHARAFDCKATGILMQFSMLSSECCFLGVSADLKLALSEPFHDHRSASRAFHIAIFASNALLAALLGWMQADGVRVCPASSVGSECLPVWLSFRRSPSSGEQLTVCWIRDARDGRPNVLTTAFFFAPVLLIYAYALYIYYGIAAVRLRVGGLQSSLETRRAVLERSRRLLLCYQGYLVTQPCSYLAVFLLGFHTWRGEGWEYAYYACAELFLVVLGARGVATVTGWVLADAPRWSDFMRRRCTDWSGVGPIGGEDEDEDDALRPELNSALRDEVLFYTAQGIEQAVRCAEEMAQASAVLTRDVTMPVSGRQSAFERADADGSGAGVGCVPSRAFEAESDGPAEANVDGDRAVRIAISGSWGRACSVVWDDMRPHVLPACTSAATGADASTVTDASRQSALPLCASLASSADAGAAAGDPPPPCGASDSGHGFATGRGAEAPLVAPSKVVHHGQLVQDSRSGLSEGSWATAVTLTDYEPLAFRSIRLAFSIDWRAYLESLAHKAKERFSEGRSGAFLYFSRDSRFIVKTCTKDEARTLQAIIPHYLRHVLEHPHTLLSKILGFHRIEIYGRRIHFVVMANVLNPHAPADPSVSCSLHTSSTGASAVSSAAGGRADTTAVDRTLVHERYDLKGSWVSRNAPSVAELRGRPARCRFCDRRFVVAEDRNNCPMRFNKPCMPEQQLKDNDLNYKLNLSPALAGRLAEQLRADADFLAGANLMDYSLLLGVTRRRFQIRSTGPSSRGPLPARNPSGSVLEAAGPEVLAAERDTTDESRGSDLEALENSGTRALSAPLLESSRVEADFVDGPAVYYIGIIDILQRWDISKRREFFCKVVLAGKSRHGISCLPPMEYADRFKKRVVAAIVEGRE